MNGRLMPLFIFQSLDRRKLRQGSGFISAYNRRQLLGHTSYHQQRSIFSDQQVYWKYDYVTQGNLVY